MHFTRLRLIGFRSFVESTDILVDTGLTGVVGPNGCGKSNLVEALRWVMGESSARQMRGREMDDLIFNGSDLRPKRNHAEVTLLLDNSAGPAPAVFNDSSEIEISRRIERGVGSVYRINGREARARDVQLLFADAATGAHSLRDSAVQRIASSSLWPSGRRPAKTLSSGAPRIAEHSIQWFTMVIWSLRCSGSGSVKRLPTAAPDISSPLRKQWRFTDLR